MKITQFLKNNILVLDGAMGTMLQRLGLSAGELPERWNITHSEAIISVHKAYLDAGSNVISTNTFGATTLKFDAEELEKIVSSAVKNAREAIKRTGGAQNKWVALDIGPSGKLLKPYGELEFEEAVSVFAETVKLGVKYGADLIYIETMNDSLETKAAVLAAKENSSLPVFVSNAYGEDGKLLSGTTPEAMSAMLEGLRVDAMGANCSLGPKQLAGVIKRLLKVSNIPVILKPNAGLPVVREGKTYFDVDENEFSDEIVSLIQKGVKIVGGCCGTTPEYIACLKRKSAGISPVTSDAYQKTVVSSYANAVEIGGVPVLIGERINPTGKKRFKQALVEKDYDYILKEGVRQEECGAHLLDVNVGIPDIDETEVLCEAVKRLQAVISLPLQIDTANPTAMEKALRVYNGKAMINSVNGSRSSMDAVFPLVKKYGGVVVALTLDEKGIPASAKGRVEIAKRILLEAKRYGIDKKDIVFDTLTMTVSADTNAANVTLEALGEIRNKLRCNTVLGVSNVSFGLPNREAINAVFFTKALNHGLSAAIMNPFSYEMMKTYYAYLALTNLDKNCVKYMDFIDKNSMVATVSAQNPQEKFDKTEYSPLQYAIIKGMESSAGSITDELLKTTPPLEIASREIIPALDEVGKAFEHNKIYLPGLLMSAEAAKAAFERVRLVMQSDKQKMVAGKAVIATVKGDIHDIGKNIVKLLLENYGFAVTDLGKDVAPELILDAVLKTGTRVLGLSALMTTTVPYMEQTIALIHEKAPLCKVIVGGAVLNPDYAKKINADYYAADAMETVRIAEKIYKGN